MEMVTITLNEFKALYHIKVEMEVRNEMQQEFDELRDALQLQIDDLKAQLQEKEAQLEEKEEAIKSKSDVIGYWFDRAVKAENALKALQDELDACPATNIA